jgi:hypothetical protein
VVRWCDGAMVLWCYNRNAADYDDTPPNSSSRDADRRRLRDASFFSLKGGAQLHRRVSHRCASAQAHGFDRTLALYCTGAQPHECTTPPRCMFREITGRLCTPPRVRGCAATTDQDSPHVGRCYRGLADGATDNKATPTDTSIAPPYRRSL